MKIYFTNPPANNCFEVLEAKIINAFVGKRKHSLNYGLNIDLKLEYADETDVLKKEAYACLTFHRKYIDLMLKDFNVKNSKDLSGKLVFAYGDVCYIAGLSRVNPYFVKTLADNDD
jgi:hypothetical protein